MPRLIVTRPARQAEAWLRELAARGVDAVAVPLLEIVAGDAAAIAAAWAGLAGKRLVVFVSANAVDAFFAARPAGAGWPAGVEAAAPGPGTAATLRAVGVDAALVVEPDADAAPVDSEALWQRLRGRDLAGAPVLIVRGDTGREWLGEQLAAAGAQVDHLAAYARRPARLSAAEQALVGAAAERPEDRVWLFSSAEAIDHLVAAFPGRWTAARAIATHPRIAARARSAGFGRVFEVAPGLDAVVACIQSLRP